MLNLQRRKISCRGFTLMEMVIVIAIMLILAGVAIPAYNGIRNRARKGAAKAEIQTIVLAINDFQLDLNRYPKTLEELVSNVGGSDKWDGPYFGNTMLVPKDPWGNAYQYTTPGQANRDFEIVCFGKDGSPGGTGSNADISNYMMEQ